MKKKLVVAIAAISAASTWAMDGIDFSGENGRTSALQMNYLNLNDAQDYWGNPAHIVNLKDNAVFNVTAGGEGGGAIYTLFGQKVGLYFGRPSQSLANTIDANDFQQATDLVGGTGATGETVLNADNFDTPTNVLDAFWAMNAGFGDLGIRLNFQRNSEDTSGPTYVNTDPAVNNVADTTRTTDTVADNSVNKSFQEINLQVGVVPNGLPFEGTLLVGLPSGSSTSSYEDTRAVVNLDGAGTVTDTTTDSVTAEQTVETDALNLALVVKGDILTRNTTTLRAAGYYSSTKYNATNTTTSAERARVDANGDGNYVAVDGDTDSTDNKNWTGESTNTAMSVGAIFTAESRPSSNTRVLASLGAIYVSGEYGVAETRVNDSTTDNISGTTTGYPSGGGNLLGSQDSNMTPYSMFMVPITLAFEAATSEKTQLRASVGGSLFNSESESFDETFFISPNANDGGAADATTATNNVEDYVSNDPYGMTYYSSAVVGLGFSYKWSNQFTIDGHLAKQFFTNGFDSTFTSTLSGIFTF